MYGSINPQGNNCNIKGRCGKFRTCAACARLRQARFADEAERLLAQENALYLTRITPVISNKHEITRVKNAIKHQLGSSPAVWSIEIGTIKHQLHLNLISSHQRIKPIKNATQHTTAKITDLRTVAAYMLKQEQIPSTETYDGRQHGAWNSIIAAAAQHKPAPVIQAAAIQTLMGYPLDLKTMPAPPPKTNQTKQEQDEQYRARAQYYLSGFMRELALNKGTDKQ